jgi:WD40 repeat protein
LYTLDGERVGDPVQASNEQGVPYVAFSDDSTLLATGGFDGVVRVYTVDDVLDLRERLPGNLNFSGGLAFEPGGETLLFGTISQELGGEVVRYDIETDEVVERFTTETPVAALDRDPQGTTIAVGETSGAITLWDADGPRLGGLVGHAGTVLGVAFVDDGTRLVSVTNEGELRVWDVSTRQPVGSALAGHLGEISAFGGDPGSSVVASGGFEDHRMVVWDFGIEDALIANCDVAGRNLTREEWEQYLPDESYHLTCQEWPAGE